MKRKILILLLLVVSAISLQQASAQDTEDNLILNHNFTDGFDHWDLIGEDAGTRFELIASPNDDGQSVFYEGGSLIQLFSELVPAEENVEYVFRIFVETWGDRAETDGANFKLIFFDENAGDVGEGDRTGEVNAWIPVDTQEFVYAETSGIAPENTTHLQVEFATWHEGHDITLDAIYVMPATATSVEDFTDGPREFRLEQNYPNPFNPATQIQFTLAQSSDVTMEVFNLLGQRVAMLVDENMSAGTHEVNFDASSLTSGVYMYRIQAGDYSETRKMTLLK